jgi:NADH:ubiquinone reductase (H+-translocating)
MHRIVIVGGGAAGLELATRLGDRFGRNGQAQIELLDRSRAHLWKPQLHEIASGSMDPGTHELDYSAQGRRHHFRYRLGEMISLDRQRRELQVGPIMDEEDRPLTPRRTLGYDTLIVAVGSLTNDFGVPGVKQHAIALESTADASRFQRLLVNSLVRAQTQSESLRPEQLHIAIVGAGATGVELAAELRNTTRDLVAYGLDRIDADRDIKLELLEATDRILPPLPPRVSEMALKRLYKLGVAVRTSAHVAEILPNGVRLADGTVVPAELTVWAAGVKAPHVLTTMDGLETNRQNQLVVLQTLQTTLDEDIFALGDCAACPWPEGKGNVPPRAQAAHQQASHMARQIQKRLAGRPLAPFRYRDFGSLVSLGRHQSVGNLAGLFSVRSVFIEGLIARIMYLSIRKTHQLALHGLGRVMLDTLAEMLAGRSAPRVKLH